MPSLNRGDIVRVQSYKYPNQFHRVWKKSIVLKVGEPIILANQNVEVVESDGREWIFPGLAVCCFFKEEWFNSVMLYKEEGGLKEIYCNLATPYQLDASQKILTYIDLDIDFIVHSDLTYQIVDQGEFVRNWIRYAYPTEIVSQVERTIAELKKKIEQKQSPFHPSFAEDWYQEYDLLERGGE
jgi:uncharacterized protein